MIFIFTQESDDCVVFAAVDRKTIGYAANLDQSHTSSQTSNLDVFVVPHAETKVAIQRLTHVYTKSLFRPLLSVNTSTYDMITIHSTGTQIRTETTWLEAKRAGR